MDITILVAAVVAAVGGYLVARRRSPGEDRAPGAPGAKGAPPAKSAGSQGAVKKGPREGHGAGSAPEASPFEGMALGLGDVVLAEAEERWLAGAIVARESGRVVSVLFVAPEGAEVRAVAAFAPPRKEIFWLAPVTITCPAEPPATLEIGASMLDRRSRVPVSIERLGQGAPHVGDPALWALYEGGGRDVALVITSGGQVHAWSGRRLDETEYERLGAGGTEEEV